MLGCAANNSALSLLTRKSSVWLASSAGPVLMLAAQPLTGWGPASSGTVWSAPLVKEGASLTGVMVIVKVWLALVSTPPLAAPPLSCNWTVTVALPLALVAAVYVNIPLGAIAGCAENSPLLLLP